MRNVQEEKPSKSKHLTYSDKNDTHTRQFSQDIDIMECPHMLTFLKS